MNKTFTLVLIICLVLEFLYTFYENDLGDFTTRIWVKTGLILLFVIYLIDMYRKAA